MSIRAEWQASMQCGKRDIRLWISVNFAGVNNSKSILTKTSIDHCENVINFKVVSKNTMKRDSSLNVYRQRKISFEDRVVVEGSKTTSINQYGAGPSTQKLSTSIISEIGGIRILSYLFLIKDPKSNLYMPIYSAAATFQYGSNLTDNCS